jgi:peptide deformylase
MAVRTVTHIGNPILRRVARNLSPQEIVSPATRDLLGDMVDTMHHEGGIGIAAPQVGESLQLAVVEIDAGSSRYPGMKPFDLEVFVNPRLSVLDETEQAFWEGCLSVPDLRGLVHRPRAVRVDYVGLDGQVRRIEAEGFLATVLHHELDHLAGILFIDKVRDTTNLATVDDYRRYWLENDEGSHDI